MSEAAKMQANAAETVQDATSRLAAAIECQLAMLRRLPAPQSLPLVANLRVLAAASDDLVKAFLRFLNETQTQRCQVDAATSNVVQDAIDDARLAIKALEFDRDATRRELDDLRDRHGDQSAG